MSRLDPLRAPVRTAWWRQLARGARDVTAASTHRRALVVAPHPDDETIGAGASIARRTAAGTPVDVVVLSDGASLTSPALGPGELAAMRAAEVTDAAAILGVRDLRLLAFPDDRLGDHVDALVETLTVIVRETRPDEILTTSGRDWHTDHRVASRVARVVAERTDTALAEFPIWYRVNGPWAPPQGGSSFVQARALAGEPIRARHGLHVEYVDTDGFISAKQDAMDAHRSQFRGLDADPAWPTLDHAWREMFLTPRELFFRIRG